MEHLEYKLIWYCYRLNGILNESSLSYEDREKQINEIINVLDEKYNSSLYFDRSVYIAHKFDSNEAKDDLILNPINYTFEISDDMDEHPGVVVKFRKTDGDILSEYCNKLNNILSSGNKELIKKGFNEIHSKLQNHDYRWSIYWDQRIFNEGMGNGQACLDTVSENGNEYRCKICIEGYGDDYMGLIVEHKK